MSCDFRGRMRSFSPYSLYDITGKYQGNLLNRYHDAWNAFEYIDNKSTIRSCEQEIIKLDKIELQHFLQQIFINPNLLFRNRIYATKNGEMNRSCVLFHLLNVFCTHGQEEKMRVVQVKLNEVLHTVTEAERCDIIERYISQLLKAKSSLTEIDMLTGQIDSQHELLCKLFYWDRFYSKNGNEGCKEFLKINADFLVSNIEGMATNLGFMQHIKLQLIACNILLCLLNWNICKTQKPVILQKDMEKPVPSSVSLVADPSTNYSFTNRARHMLQKILSTLSEEEIFNAFNDYLEQMYAMNSEITEDDLCIGIIEPYNEFLLKLCYCEALCNKNDAFCMEFLRRNVDLFVLQIELVADEENKKLKSISCTILLCLLNLNMSTSKTTPLMVQNTEIQACPSEASVADTSTKYYYTEKTIRSMLHKLISTFSEDDIYTAFKNYLNLMYAMKSEITEDDFCTGKIEPYHEFLLKLCYCDKLCNKMNDEIYKEFLRRNADYLVTQIEEVVNGNKIITKLASCKILLHLLNWNICNLKTTLHQTKIQNRELKELCSFQSEEENTTKNTMYKVRHVLQNLFSTLTYHEISQVFNDYIEQLFVMKSEITSECLCIGETEPNHEYQLKLCYWTTICRKNDNKAFKKFIQLYPEVLVSDIKKRIVLCQGSKTKRFFCKILLCILKYSEDTEETIGSMLQSLLSTFSEEEIFTAFNNYLDILYAINSEITEDDFCTGKIEPYHEFMLKLCHYEKLCNKNDQTCIEFLRRNADMFVSQIEILGDGNKIKWKPISGTILLCLLKFNMCTLKTTPLMVQNTEIQTSSLDASVADTSTKYSYTANTIWSLLKTLLSTLSEDDMFTTFNNYLGQLYAINSEITEDDFCTGKIEPYHEFLLKLCYYEKLCIKKDEKKMKKFLSRNADFLVSQIEEGVYGEKTQFISCKVLLCLSKWGISNKNTAYTSHGNILSQTLTFNADYQDFINENALVFLSMVDTVMTKNNITLLINLCDVLLCIPCNGQHFHDVIGAAIKLIRYYATQVGINKKCLGWIIKLRYRVLKHVNDNQKLDTAIKIEIDFQNLFNLLDALLTYFNYNSKTLERGILLNSFKSKIINHRWKRNNADSFFCFPLHYQYHTKEDYFNSLYHSGEGYEDLASLYNSEEAYENFASFYYLEGGHEDFDSHYHTMELFETRLRELWIAKIKCKVKATQISNKIRNKGRENLIQMEFLQTNTTMSEQDFIFEWKADLKENQLNIKTMEDHLKEIKMVDKRVDEMVKKLKLYEMLLLFMMTLIVMVGVSNGHHKSAKLKKYLSLKYEYATASLYLLWCSGDIEVHPGPSLNKKSLAHDSSIERRWIQNISPKIIFRLPEHEQSKYKPTKKERNDKENREHFKALLKTCLEEKVHVPKMYLAEINAWEIMEYKLLHRLFVYRCEFETIIASLQDFLTCGGSTNKLTDINISFDTELQTNEITSILGKDQRPIDKSQLIVYITRHIAGIAIKCAHEKDPDAKCDGLWDLPLKHWPKHIILFDPNNRGKYSKKHPTQKLISDQDLVDMLLTLPQVIIKKKYKEIVKAFRIMRKSQKDKSINKMHKAELCSTFKRITSLEKLDYALKNLWESGIFTEEVHNNLNKWWTTGAVDTTDINQNLSQVNIKDAEKKRRPHILMNISTKSITLTVEQSDANSSQVSYDFPFSDECVPLKTMATIVHQTTIHKASSDSYQKVTAEKYLTDSPKQDACLADNQINLIIIPPEALRVLNTYFPCDIYPDSQAILENDIKHQHEMSSQELALCSIHFDQQTFSTNQFSQWNQNIAIFGQPGHILCTPNQSTTNLNDISSATKDSQNPDFYMQVSPTSDMGSSDSISSVNSGNEEKDQNSTSNGDQGQDQLTDSDYSSDSSNNCVSKTSLKKRKCIEEDRIDMKKRKIPSLKQDKKQSATTSHRKIDSSMDNSTTCNKDMELLLDYLDIDLDSFDIDDQTFEVEMNALGNEDKNLQVCDKDRNLMNDEIQMSNKNTTVSAYDTNVSSDLEIFLQEMICGESEKMIQMKSYLSDV